MRVLSASIASCLCVVLLGCHAAPPARARSVQVSVVDEEGRPLFDVPVAVDALWVTRTHASGIARLSLSPQGPARARIGVRCGADQREPAPRSVPRDVAGGTATLELSFVCRPRLRKLAIVIRAPGAEGMLVRADGEPVGAVAADGTFHATLFRKPDSALRITIDTADAPVTPSKPERVMQVHDRDELFIVDQPVRHLSLARVASVRRARLVRFHAAPSARDVETSPEDRELREARE